MLLIRKCFFKIICKLTLYSPSITLMDPILFGIAPSPQSAQANPKVLCLRVSCLTSPFTWSEKGPPFPLNNTQLNINIKIQPQPPQRFTTCLSHCNTIPFVSIKALEKLKYVYNTKAWQCITANLHPSSLVSGQVLYHKILLLTYKYLSTFIHPYLPPFNCTA